MLHTPAAGETDSDDDKERGKAGWGGFSYSVKCAELLALTVYTSIYFIYHSERE